MTSQFFIPQDSFIKNNFRDIEEPVAEGQFKALTEGGFGQIYKVRGTGVFKSSIYALKRFKDHHERDKRFEKEWQSLKFFNELSQRDENYKEIHIPLGRIDVYQEDHCIIMPWIEGEVLEKIIFNSKSLSVEEREQEIIIFLKDTLKTLHLIHQKYIHRDINPKNIIQNKNRKFIIIDFGLVYEYRASAVGDEVSSNTSYTTVQEQTKVFDNGGYSSQENNPCCASDIYSLGAIAIAWITLKSPYNFIRQQDQSKINLFPDKLRSAWDSYRKSCNINTGLSEIISKMVELTTMTERYQTCQAVLDDLTSRQINTTQNAQYESIEQHFQSDPPNLALANEMSFNVIRCLAEDKGQSLNVEFLAFPPRDLKIIVREVDKRLNNALQCQNKIFESQNRDFSRFCQQVGWLQDDHLLSKSELLDRLTQTGLNNLPAGFFPFIFHRETDTDLIKLERIYREWFAQLRKIFG